MNRKFKLILVVFVSVILLTKISVVAAFKNVSVGTTAPNVTLKDINEKSSSLETIYGKGATILLFWATWSPRSVEELKDLQKLYDSYKEKGVEIVAINVEKEVIVEEDIAKIKAVIEENGIKFTVLLDEGLSTFQAYGVVALPSTAIIKKGGEIIKDYAGYATFAANDIKENLEYEIGVKERPKEVEVAEVSKVYKPIKASLLRYGLGKTLIARGMPDKSVEEFKKSIELDPKFDQPHVLLAEVYYNKAAKQKTPAQKEKLIGDAKSEYEEALKINPDNLPALSGLALTLLEQKSEKEAEEHINKALTIEPNFTPALSAMGMLLKNKGESEKAIEKFNAALELNKNQPEIHYLKALTYKEAGKNELAVASLKDAFKLLIEKVSLATLQEKKNKQ